MLRKTNNIISLIWIWFLFHFFLPNRQIKTSKIITTILSTQNRLHKQRSNIRFKKMSTNKTKQQNQSTILLDIINYRLVRSGFNIDIEFNVTSKLAAHTHAHLYFQMNTYITYNTKYLIILRTKRKWKTKTYFWLTPNSVLRNHRTKKQKKQKPTNTFSARHTN